MIQRHRFDSPTVEGIFLWELTWVLTPCPKTLLDKRINRGLVCAYTCSIAQTQLTFMSSTGECHCQ